MEKTNKEILAIWYILRNVYYDQSTDALILMTAQVANVDFNSVVIALANRPEQEEQDVKTRSFKS